MKRGGHGAALFSWLLKGDSRLDIPLELELPVDHYRRLARHMKTPGLLPNEQAGCLTDAMEHGAQAILEKMTTTLPLVMNGVDLVQGPGALETSNTMTL